MDEGGWWELCVVFRVVLCVLLLSRSVVGFVAFLSPHLSLFDGEFSTLLLCGVRDAI